MLFEYEPDAWLAFIPTWKITSSVSVPVVGEDFVANTSELVFTGTGWNVVLATNEVPLSPFVELVTLTPNPVVTPFCQVVLAPISAIVFGPLVNGWFSCK